MTVLHNPAGAVSKLAGPVVKLAADELEFVLSDATVDRYGDTIDPAGWVLTNFRKNPIALFNHDSDFPIGMWESVRVEGGKLIGKLKLAASGTSARIDELVRLAQQGILRAVSVGFLPMASEPREGGGRRYTRQELLECSLVSVPANPAALQLARSLHVSDDTIHLAFGEHAGRGPMAVRRSARGENAGHPSSRKPLAMNIAKRIEGVQQRLVELKDQLTNHLATVDDANPDETALTITDELNASIETQERSLASLRAAEARLASTAAQEPTLPTATVERGGPQGRPFAVAAKKVEPVEFFFRSAVVATLAHLQRRSVADVLRERYGEDQVTRAFVDVVTKASVVPATTTQAGWAAELVQTAILDLIDSLMPLSIYPGLVAKGGRFTFGRNGVVSIPSRAATPSVAGSFVGQGAPIPVRRAGFASTSLTPKKMGVISTFTREIAEHSTPSIEAILRQAILEDTAASIDTVLIDANAATNIRPAGLLYGVAALTATAGGGFAALVADIKKLVGALIVGTNGNIRAPVWLMNPVQALSIALTQNAGGDFPFKAEMAAGNLQGYPVLQSVSIPAGTLILVDAADFFSATGDEPRFDVSDQAVLHMEDTAPAQIGVAGTPNVVAAPVQSLWQTDTLGIRMLLDINWALRRAGVVAWTQSVTW